MNDLGGVVGGYQIDADGHYMTGYIYTKAGGMENLNDLIAPVIWFVLDQQVV